MTLKNAFYFLIFLLFSSLSCSGTKENDRITKLPGQSKGVDFEQYSGYITVDPHAGRALFYYFVQSPRDSSSKPLVLWLDGGPGCSALGDGAMLQIGPFRVNKDGKTLTHNKYAWNQAANVLFLESPAGVGFSYSNTTSENKLGGDNKTAYDNYAFLQNWLKRYPEFISRDFYIAGLSYAGHYATQLAQLIVQNNDTDNRVDLNFQGLIMGSPYIDAESRVRGQIDFMWSHAIISDEEHQQLKLNCNYSSSDSSITEFCMRQSNVVNASTIGNISIMNLYAPLCNSSYSSQVVATLDPCSIIYITSYLNMPQVQEALHANLTQLPYPWQICSAQLSNFPSDSPFSVLPIIQELIHKGLRVWIYSGDVDGSVPAIGGKYAVNKMKLSVKTAWYPWYTAEEVGGYAVEYEEKTVIATVRGAGHIAAGDQPQRALTFFLSFLNGTLPPSH